MAWRYYAQRLITNAWIDRDVPLQDVQITWELSGPGSLSASVDAIAAKAVHTDGSLVLDEWSTAIYAEADGTIRWGGILVTSSEGGNGTRNLEFQGFSRYPNGRVFEGSLVNPVGHKKYYEADPFDIVRYLWDEAQYDPRAKLGVVVSTNKSDRKIGNPDPGPAPKRDDYAGGKAGQAKYEEALKNWESTPSEPYELAWWNTPDIGGEIDSVLQQIEADYTESHEWLDAEKNSVKHNINLAVDLTRIRNDLRFVEGENIIVPPSVSRDGDEYANHVFAIGGGEDRHTLREEEQGTDVPRVRRDRVVTYKDLLNTNTLKTRARSEWIRAKDMVKIESIEVLDHPNASMGSWGLGDQITIECNTGFMDITRKARITSWTFSPENPDRATLTITRVELA